MDPRSGKASFKFYTAVAKLSTCKPLSHLDFRRRTGLLLDLSQDILLMTHKQKRGAWLLGIENNSRLRPVKAILVVFHTQSPQALL